MNLLIIALLLSRSLGIVASQPTATPPVPYAYWPFQSMDGSRLSEDASGNGHTATIPASASIAAGVFSGNGVSLAGSNPGVTIGNTVPLYDDMSFCAWVNSPLSAQQYLYYDSAGNPAGGLSILFGSWAALTNVVAVKSHGVDLGYTVNGVLTPNVNQFIVVNKVGASLKIYVNGSEVSIASGTPGAETLTSNGGAKQIGIVTTGLVDEVRMYTPALTAAQITSLYNTNSP